MLNIEDCPIREDLDIGEEGNYDEENLEKDIYNLKKKRYQF